MAFDVPQPGLSKVGEGWRSLAVEDSKWLAQSQGLLKKHLSHGGSKGRLATWQIRGAACGFRMLDMPFEVPVSSTGSPLHSISGSFQSMAKVEYVPVAPNSGSYEKEKAQSHVIHVLWLCRCPFGASARSASS